MKKQILSALLASGIFATSLSAARAADEKPAEYNLKFEKNPKAARKEAPEFGSRFGVSGPLMVAGGETFLGVNLFYLSESSPGLLFGGETGYYRWSSSGRGISVSQNVIPLLGTVIYRFAADSGTVVPHVGANLGVSIVNASASIGGFSGSGTETQLTLLARGGAAFGEEQNFLGELKLGVIGETFVFMPSIGYLF